RFSRDAVLFAATTPRQPARARPSAIARPMPRLAPVTIATRPLRLVGVIEILAFSAGGPWGILPAMTPDVPYRIGSGHDTHRLGEGRPLILGGVRVEHTRGLIGHSDADVVLHAVTDALLGAAGLGDIGDAYPDSDPQWLGADSRRFLTETLDRLNRLGW